MKEKDIGPTHQPFVKKALGTEKIIIHKADTRGETDLGWVQSRKTFSFADYYNRERMHFGVLRVLNDDTFQAGKGMASHSHDNMEIISILLEGSIAHEDSLGNSTIIKQGDIHIISAGSGVCHSGNNISKNEPAKFLQIWIYPDKKNVAPRCGQVTLLTADRKNRFQQILSPSPNDDGLWIQQQAWFHLGKFDKDFDAEYSFRKETNGVYIFVLSGSAFVLDQQLDSRDGMGIWSTSKFTIKTVTDQTEILLIEVPMQI